MASKVISFVLQVQNRNFIITLDNEKNVLTTVAKEIGQICKLASDKMKKLNDQIDTLKKDLSKTDCSNYKELKQLRDEMKKNDEELSQVMI